jgi:hypothetical protein
MIHIRRNMPGKTRLKRQIWTWYGVPLFLFVLGLTGFAANFIWYFFLAVILGWGDSGPEWYIRIQDWIFYGIFAVSAVIWIGIAYWRRSRNRGTILIFW